MLVDLGLILLFGLQHSIMARASFKRWWTRIVPEPIERSTYVLFSSISLGLLLALWQPVPTTVWHTESAVAVAALWTIFIFGWGLLFAVAMSAYVFAGCRFEERALEGEFGALYREYKQRVPMLVLRLRSEQDLVGGIESAGASWSER